METKQEVFRACRKCGYPLKGEQGSCPRCGAEVITSPTLVFADEGMRHGFAQVPNIVLRNPLLSSTAVRLYALLLSYAWQDKECFPGQETLAADMGCSRSYVVKTLTELRKHKLIMWKRRGQGKVNIYTIKALTDGYLPRGVIDKSGALL